MAAKNNTQKRNAYRGKFPGRLALISLTRDRGVMYCQTNDGREFTFNARDTNGKLPKLGADIATIPNAKPYNDKR